MAKVHLRVTVTDADTGEVLETDVVDTSCPDDASPTRMARFLEDIQGTARDLAWSAAKIQIARRKREQK